MHRCSSHLVAGLVAALGAAACLSPGAIDSGDDPAPQAAASDLEFCVSESNRLRALDGQPPLVRSSALEAFAADGARLDTLAQRPHGHFLDTQGGGVAFAENECPAWGGWQLGSGPDAVRAAIAACLEAFYDEGPAGGHYQNLMGDFTSLGCGLYVKGDAITIVQDFAP